MMNWWPWGKTKGIERRDVAYGDELVNYLLSQASGSTVIRDATETAALEAASGAYSRAFAGSTVSPADNLRTMPVTPAMLAMTAREMIRHGEVVFVIEAGPMGLRLSPCASFDVDGDYGEASWIYRCHMAAPSGFVTRVLPGASVLHFRYACDAKTPWRGMSPLDYARTTGQLLGKLEKSLSDESGASTGFVVPMPQDHDEGTDDAPRPFDRLRADLQRLQGKTALVETTAGGQGDRTAQPLTDWKPNRFGPELPDSLSRMREGVYRTVLAACGVPVGIFDSSGSSQEGKESWRRFVFGSVSTIGRLVSLELSRKLELDISLTFNELQAHDLSGRAASFKRMVEGNMPVEKAAALSGLLALEAD